MLLVACKRCSPALTSHIIKLQSSQMCLTYMPLVQGFLTGILVGLGATSSDRHTPLPATSAPSPSPAFWATHPGLARPPTGAVVYPLPPAAPAPLPPPAPSPSSALPQPALPWLGHRQQQDGHCKGSAPASMRQGVRVAPAHFAMVCTASDMPFCVSSRWSHTTQAWAPQGAGSCSIHLCLLASPFRRG